MAQTLIDELVEKNTQLEEELRSCQELYHDLMKEKGLESPGNRRAFMLKAQIFQLERQCMLLSQAQASRVLVLNDIESQLLRIIEDFQGILALDSTGRVVPVERGRVTATIETLQRLKNSLHRQSTFECSDKLQVPSLMIGSKYAKTQNNVTCLEVCSGSMDHINLKHVARLESELSKLYENLYRLLLQLKSVPIEQFSTEDPDVKYLVADSPIPTPASQLLSPAFNCITKAVKNCMSDLEHCCDELVSLSLLHPTAPWSVLKADKFGTLSAEKILCTLPNASRKRSDVLSCVQLACKAHKHVSHFDALRLSAAESQLSYFKHVQRLRQDYVMEMFSAILKAYRDCESDIIQTVKRPIGEVLQAWQRLKMDQSSGNLRNFLDKFKEHENALQRVSELSPAGDPAVQLHDFQHNLDLALDALERKYRQSAKEGGENMACSVQSCKACEVLN